MIGHAIKVTAKIKRHWLLGTKKIFLARYRYDLKKRIFKFAWQPVTGELLFDVYPTHHEVMIYNLGRRNFEQYVRGICFWDKHVIYLRGHENEEWLKRTKTMLRHNGVGWNIRIIWGEKAAWELRNDLVGL